MTSNKNLNINNEKSNKKASFNKKEIFSVAFRLTLIVAVVTLMLAVVNFFTEDIIKNNEEVKVNNAIQSFFAGGQKTSTQVQLPPNSSASEIYLVEIDGKTVGCCVELKASGFSSDGIKMLVGVSSDDFIVKGVEIISASETPGIGAKVLSSDHMKKFKDIAGNSIEDIDSVSGATVTFSAVKTAVAEAVNIAVEVFGGVG